MLELVNLAERLGAPVITESGTTHGRLAFPSDHPLNAGGLPLWDTAMDLRLVYDYLCDDVPGAKFNVEPDEGLPNGSDSDQDAIGMALKVDACFGVIGVQPDDGHQAERLAKFIELTRFTGHAAAGGEDIHVAEAIGLATLGLGDFVHDPNRLDEKRIRRNETIDYTTIGDNPTLAADTFTFVPPPGADVIGSAE